MSIASELAEHVCATSYEALPAEAVHWAKIGLLDYVGVTLAGSLEQAPQLVERSIAAASQPGPSLIFGRTQRTIALNAALINGTSSHVLDFDDCNNTFGGHPSVPILPALFALGEELGASGRELIAAYVIGFEAETRIARGVHFHHYEKGWHPTATLGVFGAAAACCKLMRLDPQQTAYALSISASFASGIKSNFGTMVKSLHVGHTTRNGLFAAQLAREGFDAGAQAFEHKQGFFNVFNGEGNYDAAKVLESWGQPYDIVKPGIAIKQYPCCGSTHPALDAMLELVHKHQLTPDNVARIESFTHKRRLAHTNRPDPQSALDAKFSVQYCLARALMHGEIAMEQFDGDAYKDATVRSILPKVHSTTYTEAQFPASNHFGAEVTVTTTGGQVYSAKVDQPHGRTSDNPLSAEMLKIKFENCAARVLPAHSVAEVYRQIQDFENLRNVCALTDTLADPQPQKKRAAG
jgi:2-methylcitrate dehydratase PrpD